MPTWPRAVPARPPRMQCTPRPAWPWPWRVEHACPEVPRWNPGCGPSCPGSGVPGRLRAPSCRPLSPSTQMAHPSSLSLLVGGSGTCSWGGALGGEAGASGTCSWGGALGGEAGASGRLPQAELLLLLARSGRLSGHRGLSTASPQPVILFKQHCCLKGQAWPRGYHEPHNCSWRVGRGQASRTQHPPVPREAPSVDGPKPVGPSTPALPTPARPGCREPPPGVGAGWALC